MALGIAAGIGAALGGAGQIIAGNMQNRANRELAEYQYGKDLEMWHKGNAYNAPAAQMQRLKDAGLNPNLVYGGGSSTGNTSSQLPKYQAPKMDFSQQAAGAANTAQVLGQYMSTKKLGAEINYIDANTAARQAQTDVFLKQAEEKGYDVTFKKRSMEDRVQYEHEKQFGARAKNDLLTEQYNEAIHNVQAKKLANQLMQGKISQQNFENKVAQMDLTTKDRELMRAMSLLKMATELGIDITKMVGMKNVIQLKNAKNLKK